MTPQTPPHPKDLDEYMKTQIRKPAFWSDPNKIRKSIIFSIVLLGIFSIMAGLGLIIAANWAIIPPSVKVAGGLACLAASLVLTYIIQQKNKPLWAEAMLFIDFLLVGGNIALIQQSYHLNLSLQQGSFAWWLLSLPLVVFTRYRLLPLCSIGLLGFAVWDVIWEMNGTALAGMLFGVMLLTHFFKGRKAEFVHDLAFILAIFFLYAGDFRTASMAGKVGVVTTTLFLIFALSTPRTGNGIIRFYNCVFLLVAWRIFLLFWMAYYNMEHLGIMLIVFGTALLAGAGLYTYYFQQIQEFIKGFVRHEQN